MGTQPDKSTQQKAEAQKEALAAAEKFAEAVRIMARLRAPGGCPWDREQSFDSIKKYTLEETYEVFDAIERRDWPGMKDELGDLLLQVLFYAEMAREAGHFSIDEVVENLNAKLVRRHPHVFGNAVATESDAVLRNWEQIKKEEKKTDDTKQASLLDDIPRTMPAMMEAGKIGSRLAKVGFDWPEVGGLIDKIAEELDELREANDEKSASGIEEEFGDLMFTTANLARQLKLDPETALRLANAKVRRRFAGMEAASLAQYGHADISARTLDEMEELWTIAKKQETGHER